MDYIKILKGLNVYDKIDKNNLDFILSLSHNGFICYVLNLTHGFYLKEILDYGFDVNNVDSDGTTLLMYLFENYRINSSTFSTLLDLGCNVNICDNNGKTTLMYAVEFSDDINLIKKIVDAGENINAIDKTGLSVLAHAFYNIYIEENLLENLIKFGADINNVDKAKRTALTYAIREEINRGLDNIIEKCIKSGCNINAQDLNGNTALMNAIIEYPNKDLAPIIEKLHKYGADLSIRNNLNETALFLAAKHSNYKSLKKLIDLKANINEVDLQGRTPLLIACNNHRSNDIISLLIEKGANTTKDDFYNNIPLIEAIKNKYSQVIIENLSKEFRHSDYFNRYDELSIMDYAENDWEQIKTLLKLSIGLESFVNITDQEGNTCLMRALKDDLDLPIIEKLIEKKIFDVETQTYDNGVNYVSHYYKRTPLMLAAKCSSNIDVIKLLIQKGAKIDAKDFEGNDVLCYARQNRTKGKHNILKYLKTVLQLKNKINNEKSIFAAPEKIVIASMIERFEELSEQNKALFFKNVLGIKYEKGMNIKDYI